VLLGTVHVTFGNGRAWPRVFAASAGNMFVMRPGRFFSLHSTAPPAWALL
jgi:hypothetical protein